MKKLIHNEFIWYLIMMSAIYGLGYELLITL